MQSPLYFDCCRRSYRLGADSFPTIRYNESLLSDVIDSDLFIGAASLAQRVTTLWIIKRKPRGKDNGTLQNRNQKRQAWIYPFVFFYYLFFFYLSATKAIIKIASVYRESFLLLLYHCIINGGRWHRQPGRNSIGECCRSVGVSKSEISFVISN